MTTSKTASEQASAPRRMAGKKCDVTHCKHGQPHDEEGHCTLAYHGCTPIEQASACTCPPSWWEQPTSERPHHHQERCPFFGEPVRQASASVGPITGALAADIERYKDDPEYLREHIVIRDGEIAAQAQEIADLMAALNRALEASSIAESARLNGLQEIARLKEELAITQLRLVTAGAARAALKEPQG